MIQISWATMAGFIVFVTAVGPALIYVGRVGKQVQQNTSDIRTIFKKLDDIHDFVKNGRK